MVLRYKDDPTASIAIKLNPVLENYVYQNDNLDIESIYFILWSDENEAIGENVVNIIYKIPLTVYVVVLLLLFYLGRRTIQKQG
ncbi:hypothetical protein [Gilliamella sp. Lep-s5]|uniref:hypothetical protein n=1 Tax=Gilliamella sp. Lep-s5 TaxID=2687308 RepID=UPI0013656317|nr:hypothetical protein [Gilliamella sp. Lep-s5]MWP50291.1 hypothetical protein [Gilliamella sp. Lep-s35]